MRMDLGLGVKASIGFGTGSVAVCVALGASAPADTSKRRPNIVFLMADDQQAFALGYAGNKDVKTPNIDKLASRGLVFDRCYSTSPICMPARATVMTGMYEFKTGCNFGTGGVNEKVWRSCGYPVLLKKSGYMVGFAGKWGIRTEGGFEYAKTFDMWGGFDGFGQGSYETGRNSSLRKYADRYPHVTKALAAFAVDFIAAAVKSGKPFCLSISFKAPHKPHRFFEKDTEGLYDGVVFQRRGNYGEEYRRILPSQASLGRQFAQWGEWAPEVFQEHMVRYCRLVSGVDIAVGMITDALKRYGVAEDTVVIFTSDNGYALGSHGFQGKCLPYEEQSRIPLVIVAPGSGCAGKRTDALVANIDFAPTILDFAGVPKPAAMDGVSLKPLLMDRNAKLHNDIMLIQNWGTGKCDFNKTLAVVSDRWKYIFWPYGDKNINPSEELYNLTDDPLEVDNLVKRNANPEVLARMRRVYGKDLDLWKSECVESYRSFGTLFDRGVSWREKRFHGPGRKFVTPELYLKVVGKPPPPGVFSKKRGGEGKRK